jgi:hypothetical protein
LRHRCILHSLSRKDQTLSPEDKMPDEPPVETPIPKPPASEAEIDTLLQKVPTFTDILKEVAQENLVQAEKNAAAGVLGGHRLAWAATIGMLRRFEKKPVAVPPDKEAHLHHRMVLAISFLQGTPLCYETIGNGLYIQAAALLRQEMETIAALVEARRTGEVKKITGQGQQVGKGNIAWNMNRLHGPLSSATHLTNPTMLDGLYRSAARPEEGFAGRPVRLMPLYSKGDTTSMWAFQAGLILQLFNEIHLVLMDLYGEGANGVETRAWNAAVDSLLKAGFLVEERPNQ